MPLTDEGLGHGSRGALLTLWAVVNAVNLLQALGFLSRITTGGRAVNHVLGYAIMVLALPAAWALLVLIRRDAPLLLIIGPATFLAFVVLMAAVDSLLSKITS